MLLPGLKVQRGGRTLKKMLLPGLKVPEGQQDFKK